MTRSIVRVELVQELSSDLQDVISSSLAIRLTAVTPIVRRL